MQCDHIGVDEHAWQVFKVTASRGRQALIPGAWAEQHLPGETVAGMEDYITCRDENGRLDIKVVALVRIEDPKDAILFKMVWCI